MLISHEHKFIFIKTKKTAGTSIELALSRYCNDPEDIITPDDQEAEKIRQSLGVTPRNYLKTFKDFGLVDWSIYLRNFSHKNNQKKFYNHMSAAQIKASIDPKIWNTYFKFCIERNPYDRVISFYLFFLRYNKLLQANYSFEEFVFNLEHEYYNFPRYSINDEIAVDFVGKYENLQEDLKWALKQVDIEYDGWLPHTKNSKRKITSKSDVFFTRETLDHVQKICAKEFELLGYPIEYGMDNRKA